MDRPELIKAAAAAAKAARHSHPWNPRSEMVGVQLARLAGLKRVGVSLARIPPGKESFVYHSHALEEEWLYILAGRGIAEIDGEDHEVGPGDFMGFAAPSVAHHLRNPGEEELVYLMGGERLEAEVATFPKLGRKMVRVGDEVEIYDVGAARPFGPEA
jgi:uncharacterized cupin superfamily protein